MRFLAHGCSHKPVCCCETLFLALQLVLCGDLGKSCSLLVFTIRLYGFGNEAGTVSSPGRGGAAEILPWSRSLPQNRFVSSGPEAGTFTPITWGTPQGEDFPTSLGKMPKATPAPAREPSNRGAPLWKRCQSSEHICPLETETVLGTKKLKMLMCPQC